MTQTQYKIGMVGLGRMGANMSLRLLLTGQPCVVYNRSPQPVIEMEKQGAMGAFSLADLVSKLDTPRSIWLMLPAASPSFSNSYQERSTQSSFAQTESKALVPSPGLAKSELHQYIPEELLQKLQATRDKRGNGR